MSTEPSRESYVKGTLAQLPLPKALLYVHQAEKTGILAVTRGPKKVHIHFDRGHLVHVTSSYFPGLALGEYLVKEGRITQDVADESFENTRTGRTKQGMYLVEHGHLSPHELYEALNTHVLVKLQRLFEWPDGDIFFKQGEIVEAEHRILKTSVTNLVFTGIRDFFPMTTLPREFKGRKEMVMHRRPDCRIRVEDMAFGPMGSRVYNVVNGQRTLRQVIAGSKMPKGQAYKILYALFLMGFIGFPESLHESRRRAESSKTAKPAAEPGREGYEISIDEDLIAQALESVDRIKETVKRREDPTGWVDIPIASAPAAGRAQAEPVHPIAPEPADDLDLSLGDDSLDTTDFDADLGDAEPLDAADQGFSWDDDSPGFGDDQSPAGFGDADITSYMETGDDLSSYTSADDLVKQAVYFIEEGRFDEAERYLNRAVEVEQDYAEAYPYLGWCIYNNSSGTDFVRAESIVKKGMAKKPGMYQAFLFLGKMYMRENQRDFAELHFVKALELNIDCAEAKEEIKNIRTR
ncbi:MAG: DUF4388 domain-containing protein [Deltaproteobacteria bacterium]|nr:DUF4388 domain-containing protein [Deltaproteobacteria bacterium]